MIYLLLSFSILLLVYAAICTAYLLCFSLAGHLGKPFRYPAVPVSAKRIAVLIPAYKEDEVIIEVAKQASIQSYDSGKYSVIIIADSLQPETLRQLRALPVQIIPVSFENSTKAKALNAAMHQLPASDIAVILDADNVMDFFFLEKINSAFIQGCKVVQGHRMAKNTNTTVAVLDAISEEINNHIFRKGHRSLGLSAALIGSGMAFEYNLLKQLMQRIHTTGGFDKELELLLLRQKYTIHYLEDALVYDEKVQQTKDFRQQRTRWIAAQVKYLKNFFFTGIRELITKGNIDFFDKVFQLVLLPRIVLLGVLGLLSMITLASGLFTLFLISAGLLVCLLMALVISIPKYLLAKISWKEIVSLPVLFVNFIVSFMKMRQARKRFIHTRHGKLK